MYYYRYNTYMYTIKYIIIIYVYMKNYPILNNIYIIHINVSYINI